MDPPNTYRNNHNSHYLTESACPDLTALLNGVINYSTKSNNGYRRVSTVAIHICNTGYDFVESVHRTYQANITCTVSGWEGTEPTCTGEFMMEPTLRVFTYLNSHL